MYLGSIILALAAGFTSGILLERNRKERVSVREQFVEPIMAKYGATKTAEEKQEEIRNLNDVIRNRVG